MTNKETEKRFYTINQFCEVISGTLSRGGIYKAVDRGEIPSKRIGKRILIPASYVRELLAEQ